MTNKVAASRKKRKGVSARHWLGVGLCVQLSVLPGCITPKGTYNVPELPIPPEYSEVAKNGTAALAAKPGAAPGTEAPARPAIKDIQPEPLPDEALVEWWRYFGNSELEGLIDRGMANNPDIRVAVNRIVQAKARADQAAAGKNATVTAPIALANQAPGGTTVGSAPAGDSTGSGGGSSGSPSSQKTIQGSIRADWRLDIWGEQAALADSANFQLWRAVYERENVQRNLAAGLAATYVEYLSLNDRLRIARETEEILSATLSTVERRVNAGDATLADLEQQRATIFSIRATIPELEQQRLDAIGVMAFLVGTVPGDLKLSEAGLDSLSIPSVLPGLPSSLLLRRPDIRMAEAQLLAADANVTVARARILPPMDLTAQAGYSSTSFSQLFRPAALFWNLVDSVTISIFDSGKKKNEVAFTQAVHEELVESYARTVHGAMREVESALASVRLSERRLTAQQEAIQSSRKAWDINSKVFTIGGLDYLSLLDSQRSHQRYLDDYQRTRMEYFRSYITLFQALGGGVKPVETLPGKGRRSVADGAAAPSTPPLPPRSSQTAEGIAMDGETGTSSETFWQVELAGLYHRANIGAAWRDLRTRYPAQMEGRVVRPRLKGRLDDSKDGKESWYRLYVAKFDSPASADEFCQALKADQQRCRIVSSRSDDTVLVSAPSRATPPTVGSAADTTPQSKPAETAVEITPVAADSGEKPAEDKRATPAPAGEAQEKTAGAGIKRSPDLLPKDKVAHTVQLGAFSNRENAAIAQTFWKQKGYDTYVSESRDAGNRTLYAVRHGIFPLKKEATAAAQAFRTKEDAPAVPVPVMVDRNGKPASVDLGDPETLAAQATPAPVPEPPEVAPAPTEAPAGNSPKPPVAGKTAATKHLSYALQLGAFSSEDNAKVAVDFWRSRGYDANTVEITDGGGRRWYAVRTGSYPRKTEATRAAVEFSRKEGTQALVTPTWAEPAPGTAATAKPEAVTEPAQATPSGAAVATASAAATAAPTASPPSAAPSAAAPEAATVAAPEATAAPAQASPVEKPQAAFTIQLGAYASEQNANRSAAYPRRTGDPVTVVSIRDGRNRIRYAVRMGGYATRAEAQAAIRKLGPKERRWAVPVPTASGKVDGPAEAALTQLLGDAQ